MMQQRQRTTCELVASNMLINRQLLLRVVQRPYSVGVLLLWCVQPEGCGFVFGGCSMTVSTCVTE